MTSVYNIYLYNVICVHVHASCCNVQTSQWNARTRCPYEMYPHINDTCVVTHSVSQVKTTSTDAG